MMLLRYYILLGFHLIYDTLSGAWLAESKFESPLPDGLSEELSNAVRLDICGVDLDPMFSVAGGLTGLESEFKRLIIDDF